MPDTRLLLLQAGGKPGWIDPVADALQVAGHTAAEELSQLLNADGQSAQRVIVTIESMTDGRAFSLARCLRQRYGYKGLLYAVGDIIPDQVSMAIDCGYDGVLVSVGAYRQYGEENWLATPDTPEHLSYWSHDRSGHTQAWSKRGLVADPAGRI